MAYLYRLAELIVEVAPHLESDVARRLAWYKKNGNHAMGVQEFRDLYAQLV